MEELYQTFSDFDRGSDEFESFRNLYNDQARQVKLFPSHMIALSFTYLLLFEQVNTFLSILYSAIQKQTASHRVYVCSIALLVAFSRIGPVFSH